MKFLLLLLLTTYTPFLFAQSDSLHTQKDTVFSVLGDSLQTQKDTVFSVSGDTLVGKITIDKDNNQYLLTSKSDTARVLLPSKIKRFILYSKENNNERQVFDAILDGFYLLEMGENEPITLYAKSTYKKVTKNGPTYYTVKKKYCLIKNKIFYNLKPESLKRDLIFLVNDCADMAKRIRKQKIGLENFALFIKEYNHCGHAKK
jgi:hypothetical protein